MKLKMTFFMIDCEISGVPCFGCKIPVKCHEIAILVGNMANVMGHLWKLMTYNEINHRSFGGRYL